jgi:hypothetical protein
LILAYGQVKAASVLRGQELRQFTEAGIPLVQLLADKFTILNGKATDTGDVFKLISKRAVSFEMVKQIFEDMTDAGGMFYNMQQIQSQTLKGSMSNLRDAFDKMFMQMGNSQMSMLKGGINAVKGLAENWQTVIKVMGDGVVIFGIYKLAIASNTAMLGKETAATIASTLADKRKEAVTLQRMGALRALTVTEQFEIATSHKMTMADWEMLVTKKLLTPEMLLQAVATKRLTVMQGELLGAEIGVTSAQVADAASKNALIVRTKMLTASLKVQAAAMWATTKAMLLNPWTWAIAGIGLAIKGLISLGVKHREFEKLQAATVKSTREYANELTDAYAKIQPVVEKGLSSGADEKAMTSARMAMQQIIEKNEALKPLVEARLANITSEAAKLLEIKKLWDEIKASTAGGPSDFTQNVTSAQKASGGFLQENIVTNAKELEESITAVSDKIMKMGTKGAIYVTDISSNFKYWTEAMKSGRISVEQYGVALENLRKRAAREQVGLEAGKELSYWVALERKLIKAASSVDDFKKSAKDFTDGYINSLEKVNGIKIDRSRLDLGLSEDKLKQVRTSTASAVEMWTRAFDEIEKTGIPVIKNVINRVLGIPWRTGMAPVTVDPFMESYNAFIKKRKLTAIPELERTEEGGAPDEKDVEKDLTEKIKTEKARLKKVGELLSNTDAKTKEMVSALKKEKKDLENAIAQRNILWKIFFGGSDKPSGQKATDPRIALLKSQFDLVNEAYSKYLERAKQVGNLQAKKDITELYQPDIKGISIVGVPELSKGLQLAFSPEELSKATSIAKKGLGKLGKDATDELRSVVKKENDANFSELTRNFKDNLDKLADEIEQTQRANEFYEKMLGLTGSKEAAEKLTKAMGMTVGDVRKDMQKALGATMKVGGIDYGVGVNLSDVNQVQAAIKKMRDAGVVDSADAAQKQLDAIVDYNQKQLEEIYSSLDDFMTAEQKKIKIVEETEKKIRDIQENPNIPAASKPAMTEAATRKGAAGVARIGLEDLQKTDEYISAFEDLSRVGGATLDSLYSDLKKVQQAEGMSKEDLKIIGDLLQKITERRETANPFLAWADAVNQYKTALYNMENGVGKSFKDDQNSLVESADKMADAAKNIGAAYSTVISPMEKTITLVEDLAEGLGVAFSDETKGLIDKFLKGFDLMSQGLAIVDSLLAVNTLMVNLNAAAKTNLAISETAAASASALFAMGQTAAGAAVIASSLAADAGTISFSALAAAIWTSMAPLLVALAPILIAAAAIGAALAAISYFSNKVANDKIKAYNDLIKVMEKRLEQLQDAEEKAVGVDYVKNIRAQIAATKELIKAEQAKIDIEEKKAHDNNLFTNRDEDAIKESEDKIKQYYADIEQAQQDFMQEMTGYSTVADAAYAFADAWYEAYLSTADTFDAMSEKFGEMVDSMVVKSILAKVVEARLAPLFAMIEEAYSPAGSGGENMTAGELTKIQSYMGGMAGTIDSELTAWMRNLSASGFNPTSGKTDLTGITKSVASMSEDAADTFGGYLNSGLSQWVQQTGLQTQILEMMKKSEGGGKLTELYELQGQALSALNGIKSDTAKMVLNLAEILRNQEDSMINGGSRAVNVRLT